MTREQISRLAGNVLANARHRAAQMAAVDPEDECGAFEASLIAGLSGLPADVAEQVEAAINMRLATAAGVI